MLRSIRPESAALQPVLSGAATLKLYYSFVRDQVGTLWAAYCRHGALLAIREPIRRKKQHCCCLLISGAEHNRQVLGNPDAFFSGGLVISGPRGSVLNRLRRGLIGINGDKHRQQRRIVSPLFLRKAIANYYPQMVDVVRRRLDTWPMGKQFDAAEHIGQISLHVSSHILLGGAAEAVRIAELTQEHVRQSYKAGVWLFPFNLPGTPYRRVLRRAEHLEQQLQQMVQRRSGAVAESSDLVGCLIAAHQADPENLSRNELVEQLVVLFGASHETVAKAVTWTLFLLAQHPRIMAELYEQLRDRFGEEPPSWEDLQQVPLLDAVTKEAMRLFPPVPWVGRRVQQEAEVGGITLRRRDYLVLNHYATHRDPEVFADPSQFRPERWFEAPPDAYAYLPFSAGPRICIGKALGTVMIQLIVTMIMQRFRLTVVPHARIDRTVYVTLAPKHGLPMTIERHDGRFQAAPVRGNVHEMVDLNRTEATTRAYTIPFPPLRLAQEPLQRAAA
jgi:cytochrome P450